MAATGRTPEAGSARRRGHRAGLDLARIVAAARSLDTDTLTMQAVADALGVDRKAINHHVSDRATLLRLVAVDALSERSAGVDIPADSGWQEACRRFALAFTDSVIAASTLADHLRLDDSLLTRFVGPIEVVMETMGRAGFDDEAAVRSLALLTNICVAYARDVVHNSHSGERHRLLMVREALGRRDAGEFENLARIATSSIDTYDRKQLDLSIEIFLRGTEAVLREQPGHAVAGA